MTLAEAKSLKLGDIVFWHNGIDSDQGAPDKVRGRVIETGYAAVKIQWSDGVIGTLHPGDCRSVSKQGGKR